MPFKGFFTGKTEEYENQRAAKLREKEKNRTLEMELQLSKEKANRELRDEATKRREEARKREEAELNVGRMRVQLQYEEAEKKKASERNITLESELKFNKEAADRKLREELDKRRDAEEEARVKNMELKIQQQNTESELHQAESVTSALKEKIDAEKAEAKLQRESMRMEMQNRERMAESNIQSIKEEMKSQREDAASKIEMKDMEMKDLKEHSEFKIDTMRDEMKSMQTEAASKVESLRKEGEMKEEALRSELASQKQQDEKKAESIRRDAEAKQDILRREKEESQRQAKLDLEKSREEAEEREELRRKEADAKEQDLRREMASKQADYSRDLDSSRRETRDIEQRENAGKLEAANELAEAKFEMYERMLQNEKENTNRYVKFTDRVLDTQAKQFQDLTKSITEGFSKMAIGPATQNSTGSTVLKNASLVMLHNFRRDDRARKIVAKDFGNLTRCLEDIGDEDAEERKGDALTDALKECGENDYSEHDGIVVVVFAPGFNMMMYDEDGKMSISEVCTPFVVNQTLIGKPKIFLIHTLQRPREESPLQDQEECGTDVLTCYCEMPEDAYVNLFGKNGSLFVKAFCKIIKNNPKKNIAEILNKVQDEVIEENEEGVTFAISDNLTKPIHFRM